MKKFIFSTLTVSLVLLALITKAQDPMQDPKYGADEQTRDKCRKHLAILQDGMRAKDYEGTLNSVRYTMNSCPQSTKNIYIHGTTIIEYHINKNKNNQAVADKYIDTLMLVYDKRIESFGQKGYVLGRKGTDLLQYRKEAFEEAYKILEESVNLETNKSEDAVLLTFMQATVGMYKNGKIDEAKVLDNFELISKHLEYRIKNPLKGDTSKVAISQQALEKVEELYKNSGAANCEALIKSFTPKYDANPENLDLLKKITQYLGDLECTDSPLYSKASEKLYALEPSPAAAANLARYFFKKEQYDKSLSYYEKTINTETDNDKKADYLYQKASILFMLKQYSSARAAALEAASNRPNWGAPYILIGKMYAASGPLCKSQDNIDVNAVFWVAVDKFAKAKAVDPSVAAEANELINKFTPYFPNVEEAFMFNVKEGNNYTVGCWINETTKARFNK